MNAVHYRTSATSLLTRRLSRHPERYLEILSVIRRYRLHRIVAELGITHQHIEDVDHELPTASEPMPPAPHAADNDVVDSSRNVAAALEELGPCFIKLGQLLSTRPDLLPASYIRALTRLQDTIAPVPAERVIQIIQSEFQRPLDDLFQAFDRQPLATASMAQVHRAVLTDGTEVAVKIQRPGVRRRIEIDLEVLREVADFAERHTPHGARYGLVQMVHELALSLRQELDFRLEAENTRLIGRQIASFEKLCTPAVYLEYTSQRVLTLSFLHGRHLADVPRSELEHLDVRAIARDLLSAYMKQVAVDGVFHCDPHPGNLLLTDDGRLALMDFGMVGRFDASQKDNMILFLLAFSERLGERVAEIYLDMIERPEGLNQRGLTQDVGGLVTHYQKEDVYDWLETYGQIEQDLVDLLEQSFKPDPPAEVLLDPTHFPSSPDPTHPCSTPGKCSATPSRNWRIAARS